MPYPFVLVANGDYIARVNHDGTWSVRWDRVIDVAYAPPHPRHTAVIATAKVLLAAKDNFILTPWALSDQTDDQWKHFQAEIEYIDHDPKPGRVQSTISYNGDVIAQVNYDGSWSIAWDDVTDLARLKTDDFRAVALVALCRLFMAAKDRFWTTPWAIAGDADDI